MKNTTVVNAILMISPDSIPTSTDKWKSEWKVR